MEDRRAGTGALGDSAYISLREFSGRRTLAIAGGRSYAGRRPLLLSRRYASEEKRALCLEAEAIQW